MRRRLLLHLLLVLVAFVGCRGRRTDSTEPQPAPVSVPAPGPEAAEILDQLDAAPPGQLGVLLERLAKLEGEAFRKRPQVLRQIPRLERALEGPTDEAVLALVPLIYIGPPTATPAVPKMLRAAGRYMKAHPGLEGQAAIAVVYIPAWGEPGTRALARSLDDRDTAVAGLALQLLTNPGVVKAENVNVYVELLGHRDPNVRKQVLYALGREGRKVHHLIPTVERLFNDRNADVRRQARYTLQQLTGARSTTGYVVEPDRQ